MISVPINDPEAFAAAVHRWNEGPYKTAGFCHEIVMMNYGGIRLSESFLQAAYRVCHETDTPVLCDEIQSCALVSGIVFVPPLWADSGFCIHRKRLPGGCYPASKILTSGAFDSLNQFGALVTNGQEELASLAYLITMEFIAANGEHIEQIGRRYHEKAAAVAARHPRICTGVEGDAHMTALCFDSVEDAVAFCSAMNHSRCVDISAPDLQNELPAGSADQAPLDFDRTHDRSFGGCHGGGADRAGAAEGGGTMNRPVRFGVIGCGLMGREFASVSIALAAPCRGSAASGDCGCL